MRAYYRRRRKPSADQIIVVGLAQRLQGACILHNTDPRSPHFHVFFPLFKASEFSNNDNKLIAIYIYETSILFFSLLARFDVRFHSAQGSTFYDVLHK